MKHAEERDGSPVVLAPRPGQESSEYSRYSAEPCWMERGKNKKGRKRRRYKLFSVVLGSGPQAF